MRLPYEATGFGPSFGAALQGRNSINTTWSELVWAAITVGRRSRWDVLQHGQYSYYEAMFRAMLLYANLREGPRGTPFRTTAYSSLDPSEKSAVSFFLGLTCAKLLAHQLFGVAWLMHLDTYSSILNPRLTSSRSRPDLVGMDGNCDWVVIEAKGRTNKADQNTVSAAKRQTRRLRQVAGAFPRLRAAVVAHFIGDRLEVLLQDPDEHDDGAPDLDIDTPTFLLHYYRPFVDLVESSPNHMARIGRRSFRVAPIPDLGIFVGLDEMLVNAVGESGRRLEEDALLVMKASAELRAHLTDLLLDTAGFGQRGSDACLGHDGILVVAGPEWSKETMSLDPEERDRRSP